jgi:hypothetical protein
MKTCAAKTWLWLATYRLISLSAVGVGPFTKLRKWRHTDRLLCREPIASHDEKVAVIIVMAVSRGTPLVYRWWETKADLTRKL